MNASPYDTENERGLQRLGAYLSLPMVILLGRFKARLCILLHSVHLLFEIRLSGVWNYVGKCLRAKLLPSSYLVIISLPVLGSAQPGLIMILSVLSVLVRLTLSWLVS